MTSAWVIMPPIETPITWAASMPKWASRADASSAMSSIRYEADEPSPVKRAARSGVPSNLVESPTSRLS